MKALGTLLVLLFGALPALAAPDACVVVPGPPGESLWSVSAAQTPAGELVILDSLQDRLLRLPSGASTLTQVTGPGAEMLPDVHPVQVRTLPGGDLLLQLAATRTFAPLDRSFELLTDQARGVHGGERGDGRSLQSAWIWEPITADELVACSDIYRPIGAGGIEPAEALVRVSLDRPDEFETLLEMPFDSPMRFACRLSLPLITVLGDGSVYALVPGNSAASDPRFDETRIYRAGVGGGPAEPLRVSLGKHLAQWPRLSTEARMQELPVVMREIELAAMPMGLFGDKDWLYLLSRSPLPGGATEWALTRIDPMTGAAAGSKKIASAANHLMVVPGPDYWALIEKGPVLSFGYQELRRIVKMPVEQLTDWRDDDRSLCQGL